MIAAGVFKPGERRELLEGEILQKIPQGSLHATALRLMEDALRKAFTTRFEVRMQLPLALDAYSEPEPDIAVVPGSVRDYRDAHPATALLIAEVSDSTLDFDRRRKSSLYARTGIPEFRVVNLLARQSRNQKQSKAATEKGHGEHGKILFRVFRVCFRG